MTLGRGTWPSRAAGATRLTREAAVQGDLFDEYELPGLDILKLLNTLEALFDARFLASQGIGHD